jgi:molybdopterin/thiamine biosynthesis adenylyltransferase/rhodanese-related sulfurtransferase
MSASALLAEHRGGRAASRSTRELPELSRDEILRYSRHLILPEVALEGQRRLKAARVLLVGAGGLGSPLALYLSAAGVGTLGLVDFDVVDVTNLQRQVLHGTSDVGRPKLESARDRLRDVNPNVHVEPYQTRLTSENALEILRDYDVVIDGTDNFQTRYLTNDACVLLGKPNVYGSIFRFEGQASVFATASGPCYRCLYPEPPPPGLVPSCAEGGVLGVLPGLVGTIQATEGLKLLLGIGDGLVGRLLLIDALQMQFRTMRLHKDPNCPACGTREIRELIDYDQFCGATTGAAPAAVAELTPREVADKRARGEDFDLIDVRERHEWEIARIEGARLVPLATLTQALATFDSAREIVVHCKGGARSASAVRQLQAAGFRRVWNLAGGITRWSDEVDDTIPKY